MELSATVEVTMKNSERYPFSIVLIHWLIAAAIGANLIIGWMLDDATELLDLHRTLGMAILVLTIFRLFFRFMSRRKIPDSANEPGTLQYLAEKVVHSLLYVGMVMVPLLGWLKTNAAGHDLVLFDTISFPTLIERNRELSSFFGLSHSIAAYCFALLIGLHVVGGIAHYMMEKRNVFKRMIPFDFGDK